MLQSRSVTMFEPVKRAVDRLVQYARSRLWEQVQYADPEYVRRRYGMYGVAALLSQCWNTGRTKEILIQYGAQIHPDCWPLGPNLMFHEVGDDFSNLIIGPHVHIGRQVFLDLTAPIILEGSVSIGMRSMLLTHQNVGVDYPDKPIAKLFPEVKAPITLRRGCSVGAGSIIHCGIEVGEDAVIGAGVVVAKSVPARTIVTSSRVKPNFQIPERYWQRMVGSDGSE